MDINDLNYILYLANGLNASDIHLSSGVPPYVRINGDIRPLEGFTNPLTPKDISNILLSIIDKYNQEALLKNLQTDFAYHNVETNSRYRVNAFKSVKGLSVVFRKLNMVIPKLEDIGFPSIMKKIANLEKGLVLICGATGSGKSTTLAILLDYINRNKNKHIITIEDPVEYLHETKQSLVDQREVGKSVKNFSDGLRGALREDPDIILVGEMRDKETIRMALTAAETGHLVLSTLHTMSASKTVDRIINSFDSEEKDIVRNMLSTSLQTIVLQTLLKNSTNSGRIAAFEIAIATSALRNLIREDKIYQIDSLIQTGSRYGMMTMAEYVEKLLRDGMVDIEEALSKLSKIDEQL